MQRKKIKGGDEIRSVYLWVAGYREFSLLYFNLYFVLFFFYNEQVKYKKECSETSRKWKNPFVMQIIASSIS